MAEKTQKNIKTAKYCIIIIITKIIPQSQEHFLIIYKY